MRRRAVVALLALGFTGCVRVRPHQRERLAHPAMAVPVWPQLSRSNDHTFEVREGTGGASTSAGGGCGCN